MRYFSYTIRIALVAAAVITLYVGVVQGEWGETMFNATLL
jgi:hypothetical protein